MARAAFLLLATAAEGFHLQATEADPCACLEWKEVYSNYLAHCGDAYEYFAAEQKGVPHDAAVKYLEQPFCRDFFEKLDDNECVNLVHDNTQKMWFTGKTWCWVSKGCPKISEMAFDYKVHAKVKFCGPEDKALGHFWPSELETYSQDHDLDVGLLAKFAYPVEHGFSWSAFKDTVMQQFCATLKDGKESESMPAAVNESEASDVEEAAVNGTEVPDVEKALKARLGTMAKAAILVNDGLPPFGVITLHSVWEVWGMEPTTIDYTHPVTESKIYCLCGNCYEH